MTDADKLLAVCRVVWPEGAWHIQEHDDAPWIFRGRFVTPWFNPARLDDLRHILLALTPGQVALFNGWMERLIHDGCGLTEHEFLTAPTSTILDALHRAVCPE